MEKLEKDQNMNESSVIKSEGIESPVIIKIERPNKNTLFDHQHAFDGNIVYQDKRSLEFDEIDISKIVFIDLVETPFDGDYEKRKKLVTDREFYVENDSEYIHLDAEILKSILEHPELIPKKWKEILDKNNAYAVAFDGTIFQHLTEKKGYVPFVPIIKCVKIGDDDYSWDVWEGENLSDIAEKDYNQLFRQKTGQSSVLKEKVVVAVIKNK